MSLPIIRALLVDDEVLARLALRQALAAHKYVRIVGECVNADEAIQAVEALSPDLLFLDIRMPGMDGFKFLHRLAPERLPLVVFCTAFGQHALRAFDADAVDYVLKPIDQTRFDQAMVRVMQRWQGLMADAPGNADATAAGASNDNRYLKRISVRTDEHIRVIPVEKIDWIGAEGNYVSIHTDGERLLHRDTMRQLQQALNPARFLRIHRSSLVNIACISEVHPLFHGNAEIVLRDGTRLTLSRRFRAGVNEALGLR